MTRYAIAFVSLASLLTATSQARQTAGQSSPTSVPAAAPPVEHAHGEVTLTAEMVRQVAALNELFAKYKEVGAAIAHGYEFVPPCVSDPRLGGMGDHYSRNAADDFGRGDGTYAVERPQYLVYSLRRDGARRLAALDYTVPYEKWHGSKPPEFFGIPFTRNDGFGVWMFHIWVFQPNPAGIFANFNPRVPQC